MATSEFDDIRPYHDGEVVGVLQRLTDNREFTGLIADMLFPRLNRFLPWLLDRVVRYRVKRQFRSVRNVRDFQMLIGENFEKLLLTASDGCTCSGIEQLERDKSYLFISNHRDIAMDPALVNLVLHRNNFDTVRIAIGDNLLSKPYTSDLMRVNKSFVVKRSVEGRREKLDALKQLSRYIRHSISVDGQSVWIAQREGRAKDGMDKTETAVLKMIGLSAEKPLTFAEGMGQLNVIPVAISYELDPCDGDKARELYAHIEEGGYEKLEHEDLASIYKGIVGYKGRVHVAFGRPVTQGTENADELALRIDREIISNYQIHPTNVLAYEEVYGKDECSTACRDQLTDRDWPSITRLFTERITSLPAQHRDIVLGMYANPVKQKRDLSGQ